MFAYAVHIIIAVCLIAFSTQAALAQQPAPEKAQPPMSEAWLAWTAVQSTTSEAILEEYIHQFPDSVYAKFARARLNELKRDQAALDNLSATRQPPPSAEATPYERIVSVRKTGDGRTVAMMSVSGLPGRSTSRPHHVLHACHGSKTVTPTPSKSATLRVASVIPAERAMAAI